MIGRKITAEAMDVHNTALLASLIYEIVDPEVFIIAIFETVQTNCIFKKQPPLRSKTGSRRSFAHHLW